MKSILLILCILLTKIHTGYSQEIHINKKKMKLTTCKKCTSTDAVRRAEYFINNSPIPLYMNTISNQISWKKIDTSCCHYYFENKEKEISLTLFIFNSYTVGEAFAKENNLSSTSTGKYSMNGPILFIVKGKDQWEVNELCSHFAGEE